MNPSKRKQIIGYETMRQKIAVILLDGGSHHITEFPGSYDGLRGRISELRRLGWTVERDGSWYTLTGIRV